MKNLKILTLFTLIIAIFACEKEVVDPIVQPIPESNCNCGTITNDGITDDCYWLDIKNDCSNNIKRFCFDYSDWLTAYVGNDVCLNGEESW